MPEPGGLRALIAIATYLRPESLRDLLASLEAQVVEHSAHVVVVDNDADGTARVVAADSPIVSTYIVEPAPGIAEARNAALDIFDERFDVILFVDDDETADARWLGTMLQFLRTTDADVALGAVHTVLDDTTPPWIVRGGFLQRGIPATGTVCPSAATNNVALRRTRWLDAGSPRFDPAFSMTGGSDTELFLRLTERGLTILFVAEAVMYEWPPTHRLTARWIGRRMLRNGIVAGRLTAARRGRRAALTRGLVVVGAGVRAAARELRTTRHLGATPVRMILMGIGESWSALGGRIYEYRRPRRRPAPSLSVP
ncbi:glycosyltransferase family 2 protein [Pseudolysinimonas yzui]|uniref:Glycosyltransferase 2-like domain-containing protein n=1 Tax=Pseudolysinimonas yzui TaxID=2708254 RepID=A0A8J3GSD5_9MICO|nr:glycosyltransferase [Pseudolysinimonas yzui]GHF21901.1 hypothetical protein GCM10011600_23670 [Pseudolysinimonas yzui]